MKNSTKLALTLVGALYATDAKADEPKAVAEQVACGTEAALKARFCEPPKKKVWTAEACTPVHRKEGKVAMCLTPNQASHLSNNGYQVGQGMKWNEYTSNSKAGCKPQESLCHIIDKTRDVPGAEKVVTKTVTKDVTDTVKYDETIRDAQDKINELEAENRLLKNRTSEILPDALTMKAQVSLDEEVRLRLNVDYEFNLGAVSPFIGAGLGYTLGDDWQMQSTPIQGNMELKSTGVNGATYKRIFESSTILDYEKPITGTIGAGLRFKLSDSVDFKAMLELEGGAKFSYTALGESRVRETEMVTVNGGDPTTQEPDGLRKRIEENLNARKEQLENGSSLRVTPYGAVSANALWSVGNKWMLGPEVSLRLDDRYGRQELGFNAGLTLRYGGRK